MTSTSDENGFSVLVNDEEQYSLWPAYKSTPNGWRRVKDGTRQECLQYIDEVWTDMRPASLRRQMQSQ